MSTPIIQLQSAFEHFNEYRGALKMSTGSPELDALIDSIQQGQFYLFYGTNKAILDGLIHGLLVNCILTIKEHGFESMAMCNHNLPIFYVVQAVIYQVVLVVICDK